MQLSFLHNTKIDFLGTKVARRELNKYSLDYVFSDYADTANVKAKYDYQRNGIDYFEYEIKDVFIYNDGRWHHYSIDYNDLIADNRKSINEFKKGIKKASDYVGRAADEM